MLKLPDVCASANCGVMKPRSYDPELGKFVWSALCFCENRVKGDAPYDVLTRGVCPYLTFDGDPSGKS